MAFPGKEENIGFACKVAWGSRALVCDDVEGVRLRFLASPWKGDAQRRKDRKFFKDSVSILHTLFLACTVPLS